MVKCLECGNEIGWLLRVHRVTVSDAVGWNDETMTSERLGEDDEDDEGVFLCPLCDKIVVNSLKEAEELFKGR